MLGQHALWAHEGSAMQHTGPVRAGAAEVTGALPPHAVTGAASWPAAQDQAGALHAE